MIKHSSIWFIANQKGPRLLSFFVFRYNGNFEYFKSSAPSKKNSARYYAGSFYEKQDTIFLEFYKHIVPENMAPYLLIDPTEENAVLPFNNKSDSIGYILKYSREGKSSRR